MKIKDLKSVIDLDMKIWINDVTHDAAEAYQRFAEIEKARYNEDIVYITVDGKGEFTIEVDGVKRI